MAVLSLSDVNAAVFLELDGREVAEREGLEDRLVGRFDVFEDLADQPALDSRAVG